MFIGAVPATPSRWPTPWPRASPRPAAAVAEGAKGKGAEVSLLTASEFSADKVGGYDAIAFGCPSMGAEQLEESEFEPMFAACEGDLRGKSIALFGSYGWGVL